MQAQHIQNLPKSIGRGLDTYLKNVLSNLQLISVYNCHWSATKIRSLVIWQSDVSNKVWNKPHSLEFTFHGPSSVFSDTRRGDRPFWNYLFYLDVLYRMDYCKFIFACFERRVFRLDWWASGESSARENCRSFETARAALRLFRISFVLFRKINNLALFPRTIRSICPPDSQIYNSLHLCLFACLLRALEKGPGQDLIPLGKLIGSSSQILCLFTSKQNIYSMRTATLRQNTF